MLIIKLKVLSHPPSFSPLQFTLSLHCKPAAQRRMTVVPNLKSKGLNSYVQFGENEGDSFVSVTTDAYNVDDNSCSRNKLFKRAHDAN